MSYAPPRVLAALLSQNTAFSRAIDDQFTDERGRVDRGRADDMRRRVQRLMLTGSWFEDYPAAKSAMAGMRAAVNTGALLRESVLGTQRTTLGYGATAVVTVPGAGGTATLTVSAQQWGLLTDIVLNSSGAPGDIEVTAMTADNDPLIVGSVPVETFDPDSFNRPPLYRTMRPGATFTVAFVNNNAAARNVTVYLPAVPLPNSWRDQLAAVINEGPTSILAWSPANGFATIAAGGSNTFQILTTEPWIVDRMVIIGGGAANVRVSNLLMNNVPMFSGSVSADAFRPQSLVSQTLLQAVDTTSQNFVTLNNDSVAAVDVCPVFIALSAMDTVNGRGR